jgi:hypothetical protein
VEGVAVALKKHDFNKVDSEIVGEGKAKGGGVFNEADSDADSDAWQANALGGTRQVRTLGGLA